MNTVDTRPSAAADPAEGRTDSLTAHLGMWCFLATEILFFGGFFAAYTLYRVAYPDAFRAGARLMEFGLGTTNTAVLLASSLAVALADRMAEAGRRTGLLLCLGTTWLLGAVFLAIKGFEYHAKFVDHLIPGSGFHLPLGAPPSLQIFFFLYFGMTGLHAAHMLFGLGALGWLCGRAARSRSPAGLLQAVTLVGLYWHFVDCIWVLLYPLFYVAGR